MEFTVLGFMGESGSGKDFCASWVANNKNFARISFADPIKRFCRTVFNFHCENLWGDPKYRNLDIVPANRGMAASSELLSIYWDRALENLTLGVHAWVHNLALTSTEQTEYVKVVGRWFDECRDRTNDGLISARLALQLLGTEYGRNFKPTLWTDYLYGQVVPNIRAGKIYTKEAGFVDGWYGGSAGVVVTDHRFLNEVHETQSRGGYVIDIIRLSRVGKKNKAEEAGIAGHASEAEQRSIPEDAFDLVLRMEDGAENVYPRLEKMFQEEEWIRKPTPITDRPTP